MQRNASTERRRFMAETLQKALDITEDLLSDSSSDDEYDGDVKDRSNTAEAADILMTQRTLALLRQQMAAKVSAASRAGGSKDSPGRQKS